MRRPQSQKGRTHLVERFDGTLCFKVLCLVGKRDSLAKFLDALIASAGFAENANTIDAQLRH